MNQPVIAVIGTFTVYLNSVMQELSVSEIDELIVAGNKVTFTSKILGGV